MAREQTRVGAEPMGSGELARAARSLESVQGNVAGQTMAIQSLSMSTQSAVLNVGAQMNALSSQLASLNSSIARLSGGMAMTAMPPPPPMMAMGGGGGFQMPSMAPFAGAAGRAGLGMMSGLGTIGTGLGYMGGAMAAPFMANVPVTRAGYGAEMAGGASAYQAAVLGSGLGVGRGTMRGMNYDWAREAGARRFGDIVGSGAVSGVGGIASLGAGMMGDFIGSRMLMPALGYSGSGLVGGLAGSIAGGAVMAPVTMAIDQTMRQTAAIGQLGDQYGRNAYRMGGSRRPSRDDRSAFGRAGLDIAIQDMTLTGQDVTDITAGMFNNDLTQGVRGTGQASDRLRELSRSVKTMARTLGGSYGEMMQTAGELQSIGMTINPETTRRAVFGGASVQGMTGRQGLAAGMNLAQPFVGMGLGAQGLGIGLMSANAGQSAVQSGALSGNALAAVGGREGAQGLLSRATANFLQGPAGMAMLAGGMTAGGGFDMANVAGKGMQGILGRGGAMAGGNNLLQLAMNPQALMEQAAKDPTALMAQMSAMAMDTGRRLAPPGASQRDIFKLGLQEVTQMRGPELDALAKTIEATPAANREMMARQASEAAAAMKSDVMEQRSVTGRFGRWRQGLTQPMAEGLNQVKDIFGNAAETAVGSTSEALYGTSSVFGTGSTTMSGAESLLGAMKTTKKTMETKTLADIIFSNDYELKRQRKRASLALGAAYEAERGRRKKVNKRGVAAADEQLQDMLARDPEKRADLASIKAKLADESDPVEIQKLTIEATDLLGEMYNGGTKGSFDVALSKELGRSVSEGLAGRGQGASVITDEMKEQNQEDLNSLQSAMRRSIFDFTVSEKDIKEALSSDKAQEFMRTGNRKLLTGMDDKQIRILAAAKESGGVGQRVLGQMRLESSEQGFNIGAKNLSGVFARAGMQDLGQGLEKGGSTAAGVLGGLELGPEEIAKLREAKLGDRMAGALGLRAGKIDSGMMSQLKGLVTPTELNKIVKGESPGELSPEELTQIRVSSASATLAGETVAPEGEGVTTNQAQMLMTTTTEMRKLAEANIRLAVIVDKIEAKNP